MISFKQFYKELTESFDSKLKSFKVITQNQNEFKIIFQTNTLEFYFVAKYDEVEEDFWDILFYRYNPSKMTQKMYNATSDVSKNEVMQVFSGVKKSIEIFIKKYDPDNFLFSGEDKKHKKLYDSIAKIIARKSNYDLHIKRFDNIKFYQFIKRN
jgi:hypothetical protein